MVVNILVYLDTMGGLCIKDYNIQKNVVKLNLYLINSILMNNNVSHFHKWGISSDGRALA